MLSTSFSCPQLLCFTDDKSTAVLMLADMLVFWDAMTSISVGSMGGDDGSLPARLSVSAPPLWSPMRTTLVLCADHLCIVREHVHTRAHTGESCSNAIHWSLRGDLSCREVCFIQLFIVTNYSPRVHTFGNRRELNDYFTTMAVIGTVHWKAKSKIMKGTSRMNTM